MSSTIVQNAKDAVAMAAYHVGQFGKSAGEGIVKGAKETGKFFTSPATQKQFEEVVCNGISTTYAKIGTGLKKAVEVMERENNGGVLQQGQLMGGIEALRAPIDAMKGLKIERLAINKEDSDTVQGLKNVANKLMTFHEKVAQTGELASRVAGDKSHALVRAALSPIRFIFKLLQVEVVGALIQNSIALAVGFAVRGIVLALSQLGHLVPYIAATALIGGAVAGLVFLAKVSPLAAAGVAVGLVLLGQQAQIAKLGQKIDDLKKAMNTPPVAPDVKVGTAARDTRPLAEQLVEAKKNLKPKETLAPKAAEETPAVSLGYADAAKAVVALTTSAAIVAAVYAYSNGTTFPAVAADTFNAVKSTTAQAYQTTYEYVAGLANSFFIRFAA